MPTFIYLASLSWIFLPPNRLVLMSMLIMLLGHPALSCKVAEAQTLRVIQGPQLLNPQIWVSPHPPPHLQQSCDWVPSMFCTWHHSHYINPPQTETESSDPSTQRLEGSKLSHFPLLRQQEKMHQCFSFVWKKGIFEKEEEEGKENKSEYEEYPFSFNKTAEQQNKGTELGKLLLPLPGKSVREKPKCVYMLVDYFNDFFTLGIFPNITKRNKK